MPIVVQGGGTVLKRTAFPAFAAFNPVAISQPSQFGDASNLPAVPVLPETLLLLEIEAHERCVDLRRVSHAVLADLGATLQILRLAGRELSDPESFVRIEDCISELGIWPCLEAMTTRITAHDPRYAAIAKLWNHARDIAHHARLIAEEMPNVNPDQAYMAGLLHVIGTLPAALGWRENVSDNSGKAALALAKRYSLPAFVSEFFTEIHSDGRRTSWLEIVRMAHQLSIQSSIHCVMEPEIRPMVYASVQSAVV